MKSQPEKVLGDGDSNSSKRWVILCHFQQEDTPKNGGVDIQIENKNRIILIYLSQENERRHGLYAAISSLVFRS